MAADVIGNATTSGALLRGSSTNEYGDEIDDNTIPVPGWSRFPVSIIEKSRSVQEPDSGAWRVIQELAARVPPSLPVQDGDRLQDLASGVIYEIMTTTPVRRSIAGFASRSIPIRRISA